MGVGAGLLGMRVLVFLPVAVPVTVPLVILVVLSRALARGRPGLRGAVLSHLLGPHLLGPHLLGPHLLGPHLLGSEMAGVARSTKRKCWCPVARIAAAAVEPGTAHRRISNPAFQDCGPARSTIISTSSKSPKVAPAGS